MSCRSAWCQSLVVLHVAPEAVGDGNGSTESNAAKFDDPALWKLAQQSLGSSPVEVVFADGKYLFAPTLLLEKMGSDEHRLTLRAATTGNVVIREDPSDTAERNPLLHLKDCRNMTMRGLMITGDAHCGQGIFVDNSSAILIEQCRWIDFTGAYYSGVSVTGARAINVVLRDCEFNRLGQDSHAHMVYTAYEPSHVKLINCTFIDSAGDYVRFRDRSDFGVVYGCTFRSTGTYHNGHMPMIAVPLFNDDNPAANVERPRYEYFGTNFLIAGNTFIYENAEQTREGWGARYALIFHHSGYDPPGRRHLLTPQEADLLEHGTVEQRKELMRRNLGIEIDSVRMFDNTYENVASQAVYRAYASYGAVDRGWSGIIDITDLLNSDPVVHSAQEAIDYFDTGKDMETSP
ncbi:MAG: right-handed parallel beta-helix repeat-containing protein [Phycisphaeraceae bacterium]|nr:right-handed parallel beta-helix repeat-containing protein [Phycisphaeraceae bacterium]